MRSYTKRIIDLGSNHGCNKHGDSGKQVTKTAQLSTTEFLLLFRKKIAVAMHCRMLCCNLYLKWNIDYLQLKILNNKCLIQKHAFSGRGVGLEIGGRSERIENSDKSKGRY